MKEWARGDRGKVQNETKNLGVMGKHLGFHCCLVQIHPSKSNSKPVLPPPSENLPLYTPDLHLKTDFNDFRGMTVG